METRKAAANAYVNGEPGPLSEIVAETSPATFFGPMGGQTVGTQEVSSKYAGDAKAFQAGGESSIEVLEMGSSGDIAYWIGFQHATARMQGKVEPVAMDLRITEIFRREGGEWKLVHRHADMLYEGKK